MQHSTLMDEGCPARIEAAFPNRDAATAAAKVLCQRFALDESQLSVGPPQQLCPASHRNSFTVRASRHRLQRRQLAATFIAFALLAAGLSLLHVIGADTLPPGLTTAIMAGLIVAAVAITVACLLSWRPVRIETRHPGQEGDTALVIHVHDLSEQYAVREALCDMGARVEGAGCAGVA